MAEGSLTGTSGSTPDSDRSALMISAAGTRRSVHTERATSLDTIDLAFILLFIVIAAASWWGIALAELRSLRIAPFTAGAAILSAAAFATIGRAIVRQVERRPPRGAVVMATVIAVGAWMLFTPPAQYVFEGTDGSVYVAIGRTIERTGGITYEDQLLRLVPESARAALFPRDTRWPTLHNRFPGGMQIADRSDTVLPNFFHLHPVWFAIWSLAWGPEAGFYVNTFFGALGVAALWLFGRRQCSAAAGAIAAGLLLVSFGQVWFARFPSSEVVSQYFLLSGLYLATLAFRRSAIFGGLSGLAFGLAAFARIDVLVFILPVVLAFAGWRAWRHRDAAARWLFVVASAVGVHALAHGLLISMPYTVRLLRIPLRLARILPPYLLIGGLVLVIAFVLIAWLSAPRVRTALERNPVRSTAILAAALSISLGPAMLGSPFGVLLSPVGVAAALIGLAVFVSGRSPLPRAPIAALFVFQLFVYLGVWRDEADMPWVFRWYVPLVLPLALLFIGDLVSRAWQTAVPLRRAVVLVPAALAAVFILRIEPVATTPPMAAAQAAVAEFSERFPDDAVLLFDRSIPSHLALAVDRNFSRGSVVAERGKDTEAALSALVGNAFQQNRPVYLLLRDGQDPVSLQRSDLAAFDVRPAGVLPLRYTLVQPTRASFPGEVRAVEASLAAYRVVRSPAAARQLLPVRIDIGAADFSYVLRGFHPGEPIPSGTARWTDGRAEIRFPALNPQSLSGDVRLSVRLATHRPPSAPGTAVDFALNGVHVARIVEPNSDFTVYSFAIPPDAVRSADAGATLLIYSATFVPRDFGAGDDGRRLGVAVDWIALTQRTPANSSNR